MWISAGLSAAWLVGAGAAQAESGVVVVGASAERHERVAISGAVEAATRNAGWTLPPKPLTDKEADAMVTCTGSSSPWACLPPSLNTSTEHVLVVGVEHQRENGTPMTVLSGKLIATSSHTVVSAQRYCDHCADDKLTEASTDLTQELLKRLAVRDGRTVLSVHSVPTGARITLDGAAIGATDGTFNIAPGSHVVLLEKDGFQSETQTATATEGKTTEVSRTLRPVKDKGGTSPTPVVPHGPERSWLVPAVVVGGGAVAVIGGGVLLAIDEDPSPGHAQKPTFHQTAGLGTGFVGVGIAAIGVGVYLAFRGDSAMVAPTSVPTLSLVPSGATVGWAGHF